MAILTSSSQDSWETSVSSSSTRFQRRPSSGPRICACQARLLSSTSKRLKQKTKSHREKKQSTYREKQSLKKAGKKKKNRQSGRSAVGKKIFAKALSSHLPAKLSRCSFYCVRIARATGVENYCESTEHVHVNTARARLPADQGRRVGTGDGGGGRCGQLVGIT